MEISMNISLMQNKMKFHKIEGAGRYGPFFLSLKAIFPYRLNKKNRTNTCIFKRNILLPLPM